MRMYIVSVCVVGLMLALPFTNMFTRAEPSEDEPADAQMSARAGEFDSDADGYTDDIDISPFGDVYLDVSIDYYSQDSVTKIDEFDDSDPFFILEVDINGDDTRETKDTSGTFTNVKVLYDPVSFEVNVNDDAESIKFIIWVYDYDALSANDILDYVPEDGVGYIHTFSTSDLKTVRKYDYNGEDDNVPNEMDCHLKYTAQFVIKETVITLGEDDNWDNMDYYYSFEFPEIMPGDQITFEVEISRAGGNYLSIFFVDAINFQAFKDNEVFYYYTSLSSFKNGNGVVRIEKLFQLKTPLINCPSSYTHDLKPFISWDVVNSQKGDYYFIVYNGGITNNGANDKADITIRPALVRSNAKPTVEYELSLKEIVSGNMILSKSITTAFFIYDRELEYGKQYEITVKASNGGTSSTDIQKFTCYNEAPTIESLSIYGSNNYEVNALEPFVFLTDVIDYDGDNVWTSIDYGDGTVVNDSMADLHVYNEHGTFRITVTAKDPWLSSIKTVDVTVKEFPFSDYTQKAVIIKGTQAITYHSNYTSHLNSYVTSPWTSLLPYPFDILRMAFSIQVDIKVEHNGWVSFEQTIEYTDLECKIKSKLISSKDEYTFYMLPYFKILWQFGEKTGYFKLPIPTTKQIYPGQMNMTLDDFTIYLWDDYAQIGDVEQFDNKIGKQIEMTKLLNMAEIDLLALLEKLIQGFFGGPAIAEVWNLAKDLGKAFLGLFGFEIEAVLNLTFDIKLVSNIWEMAGLAGTTGGRYQILPQFGKDKAGLNLYNISDESAVSVKDFGDKANIWSGYNILVHGIDVTISGSIGLRVGWIETYTSWWPGSTPVETPHIDRIELFDTADIGLLIGANIFETTLGDTYSTFPNVDTDKDGKFNPVDEDDDNDGYNDTLELIERSDPLNASSIPLDTDKDLKPNSIDPDDDNDGYNDTIELSEGTDPLSITSKPKDRDGDFIPDSMDPDAKTQQNPSFASSQVVTIGIPILVIVLVIAIIGVLIYRRNKKVTTVYTQMPTSQPAQPQAPNQYANQSVQPVQPLNTPGQPQTGQSPSPTNQQMIPPPSMQQNNLQPPQK